MQQYNHCKQKNKEGNKVAQEFGEDEEEIELYDDIYENQIDQCIDSSKKSKSTKPNNTDYATSERNENQENVAPKSIFLVSKTDYSASERNDSQGNINKKILFLVNQNSEKMENKKIFDVKKVLPVEQNSKYDFIKEIKDKAPEVPKKENKNGICQEEENSIPNYDTNHPSIYIDLSPQDNGK